MVMFLALWAWPASSAAALVIDDMEIQFGDAAVPAAQALPPSPSTDSNFQIGLDTNKVLGGARVIEVNLTGGGTSTDSYIDSSPDPAQRTWKVTNGTSTFGGGRIVWSGSNNINDCSTLNLNWSNFIDLEIKDLTTDHTTTFYVTLWSNSGSNSSTVSQLVTGGTVFPSFKVTKAQFQGAGTVQFDSICRVQIRVDPSAEAAMDTGVRDVLANLAEADIVCGGKQWTTDQNFNNLQTSLTLPSDQVFPVLLYAQLTVQNNGLGADQVYIEDYLPAGMTKLPGDERGPACWVHSWRLRPELGNHKKNQHF